MRISRFALIAFFLSCLVGGMRAQPADPASSTAIAAVMQRSADDWNRGDMDAFVTCYKNAPDILLVGASVDRGYAKMVETYRTYYGTKAKMGALTYSQIEVQPLDAMFATATGRFHLERTAEGGGTIDGFYLLVFEKTQQGWKIIRDDSTVLRPAPAK